MTNDDALDSAELALRNGDVEGAERQIAQQWPDMTRAPADAHHIMAVVRTAQNRRDDAVGHMRNAVSAAPELRHYIRLGHILLELGRHGEAADAYTNALRLDSNWPGLNDVLSQALYGAGKYPEAEAAARQGVKVAPSAGAWEALSNALRVQGKTKEALSAAEEAVRLGPHDHNAKHAKGAALLLLNRPQEALAMFDELVIDGLDLPILQMNRGAALEALGRKGDALMIYEDAARRWPDLPNLQDRVTEARKRL
ncbi:MAG: tetratricopeptide repeat protein [Alphaproteobacteria bacterium]|nr:tetratricopeptide repeat protein [Alphaproteobacteria bacterium]